MEKKENQNLENQVLRKNALEAQVDSNSNNDDDDNDNMYTCMYIIVYIYYWDMSTSLRGCLSSGLSLFGTPYTVPLRDSSPCSGIYTQPTQRYHWCPPPSPWIIWILTSSLVLMKAFFSSSSTTTRYCECYIYGPLRLPSQRGGGWPQRPIRWYSKRWHCVIRLTKTLCLLADYCIFIFIMIMKLEDQNEILDFLMFSGSSTLQGSGVGLSSLTLGPVAVKDGSPKSSG